MPERQEETETSTWQDQLLTLLLTAMIMIVGLAAGPANNDLQYWYTLSRYTFWMETAFIVLYSFLGRSPLRILSDYWRRDARVFGVILLWMITLLLSYLFSDYYTPENILAQMRVEETLGHVLFFAVLLDALSHYRIKVRWLIGAVIFSSFLVFLYFFIALVKLHFSTIGWLPEIPLWHGWAINGNIRRIGYEMETAVLATIPFWIIGRRKLFWGFLALMMLWLIFWLGGRASVLGILVGILSMGFFIGWRKTLSLAGFYLLLFVSISIINLKISAKNANYTPVKVQQTLHARSLHQFSSGRDDVWRLLWREVQKSPLIGNGPQSYFFYPGRSPSIIHAHNFLLQFLGEWGIIGAGLFLYLIVLACKSGFKNLSIQTKQNSLSAVHLAGWTMVLGLTATALFGGIYFFTQSSFFLALAYAFCLAPSSEKEN
ncbi:O-antigen ligase family protein [Nitratifractor sp.]|uniref:O-antigen ligase family protein n=1 Tax=Nitratifractor sp. TaxID=2268144 RepID=UPI002600A9DB|nr:O-antigen ligase family protein [Nitratifractor sp.]